MSFTIRHGRDWMRSITGFRQWPIYDIKKSFHENQAHRFYHDEKLIGPNTTFGDIADKMDYQPNASREIVILLEEVCHIL